MGTHCEKNENDEKFVELSAGLTINQSPHRLCTIMQSAREFKFKNVVDYRRAIGGILTSNLDVKNSIQTLSIMEIGPGKSPAISSELFNSKSPGWSLHFIEPNISLHNLLSSQFPKCQISSEVLESQFLKLPLNQYDFIFANFSLHWSENLSAALKKIRLALKTNGEFCFSITDSSRSFWRQINDDFKLKFSGCDLFRKSSTKSLDSDDWNLQLVENGFNVSETIFVGGTASINSNPLATLAEFRSACGDNYLKLNDLVSTEEAEEWILSRLQNQTNPDGTISIPASGLVFRCRPSP